MEAKRQLVGGAGCAGTRAHAQDAGASAGRGSGFSGAVASAFAGVLAAFLGLGAGPAVRSWGPTQIFAGKVCRPLYADPKRGPLSSPLSVESGDLLF